MLEVYTLSCPCQRGDIVKGIIIRVKTRLKTRMHPLKE